MKTILADPKLSAVSTILLALPFMCLVMSGVLGLELSLGPLDLFLTAEGSRLGSFIVLGTLILSLLGLAVSLALVVRGVRAGNGIMAYPVNLLAAVAILFCLLILFGAIIIDQYPCWIGVPNCD